MDVNKMSELMIKEGISALVTTSYENSYYMTGNYSLITKLLGLERLAVGVFFPEKEPVYLIGFTEEVLVKDESWIKDIRAYGFNETPLKLLMDVLSEKKAISGKVAFELDCLPASLYQGILSHAPNLKIVDASGLLSTLRAIKDEKEIEFLAFAAQAQRKAVEAAFELAKPGDTEKHIASLIMQNMLSLGVDEIAFMSLTSGLGSLKMHALPSERRIKKGEITRVDCGGLVKGYFSDLARTYAVSEASDEQRQIYKALVRAEKAAIDSMHVGVKISDVYNTCKRTFENNYPVPFDLPFVGHGLGVFCHEDPFITPDNKNLLEENMVIEIEPVYFHPESFFHKEDLVQVTASGPKVLTGCTFNEELPIIK